MIRAFIAALAMVVALMPSVGSAYDHIEVLAVGVTKHEHGLNCMLGGRKGARSSGKWCNLPNGHSDAADFESVLNQRAWLGHLNVVLLPESKSTRDGIQLALHAAASRANQKGKRSLLIFYFAGHGHTIGESGYLIPRDGKAPGVGNSVSWLSLNSVKTILGEYPDVHHHLVLLNSCYSGQWFRRKAEGIESLKQKARMNAAVVIDRMLKKRVAFAIAAGAYNEVVGDGKPGEGSPFGQALVGAFSIDPKNGYMDADENLDKCISGVELSAYLENYGQTLGSSSPHSGSFGTAEKRNAGTIILCAADALKSSARSEIDDTTESSPGRRGPPSEPDDFVDLDSLSEVDTSYQSGL